MLPPPSKQRNTPSTRQILDMIDQNGIGEKLAALPGYVDSVTARNAGRPTLASLIENFMEEYLPEGREWEVLWQCTNWQEVAEAVREETAMEEQYRVRETEYASRYSEGGMARFTL